MSSRQKSIISLTIVVKNADGSVEKYCLNVELISDGGSLLLSTRVYLIKIDLEHFAERFVGLSIPINLLSA